MGKHKHRRHERESGYVQQPMNQGYNNGNMAMNPGQANGQNQYVQNGLNPAMAMNQQSINPNADFGMNNQMNQGMNNMGMNPNMNQMNMNPNMNQNMNMNPNANMMNNPLLGLLGSLGGLGGGLGNGLGGGLGSGLGGNSQGGSPDMSGIIQMLNGFGLGIDPSIGNLLGGIGGNGGNFDIMQMIGSIFGSNPVTSNQGTAQAQVPSGYETGASLDNLVTQISPDQMRMIQGILHGFGINESQTRNTNTPNYGEKKEDSVEEILASLDFNAILNNLDNENFFGMDMNNISGDTLEDINVDEIVNGEDFGESMGEVKDADIIEENILRKEKELTKEDYKKLINVLIKLIDPNKIRLLQRVFNEYEKRIENK